jgi:hypothetical protein
MLCPAALAHEHERCRFIAWESILDEKEALDLSPHQVRQAETQKASADGMSQPACPKATSG